MKGLIVAGYGGHAGYAFAVAYELVKAGTKLDVLLPRGHEYLAKKFNGIGRVYYMTLPRRPLEPFHKGLHRWFIAFIESLKIALEEYDFVFTSGSNFSVPPSTTLRLLKKTPLYVLEDVNRFTKPAKAVKALRAFGATTLLQWNEQKALYPDGVIVGPVYEPALYRPRNEGYLLVTLGTIGSHEVFNTVVKLDIEKAVVQTGDIDPKLYSKEKPNWTFFRYTEDLHWWLAGASAVITHPGTTAVTARLAYNKPVVIVYTKRHSPLYPKSDVKKLAEKLGAVLVEAVSPEALIKALKEAEKLSRPSLRNGAIEISRIIVGK